MVKQWCPNCQDYTLNCDYCGEVFITPDAFPSPQLCPKCSKCGLTISTYTEPEKEIA